MLYRIVEQGSLFLFNCVYSFCFPTFGRREESLPVFKRRLLGGLLDFAAGELQVQVNFVNLRCLLKPHNVLYLSCYTV